MYIYISMYEPAFAHHGNKISIYMWVTKLQPRLLTQLLYTNESRCANGFPSIQ